MEERSYVKRKSCLGVWDEHGGNVGRGGVLWWTWVTRIGVCMLVMLLTCCCDCSARRPPRVFVPPEHLPKDYCMTVFGAAVSDTCCAALSGVVYSPPISARASKDPLDKMLPRKDKLDPSGGAGHAQKFELEGLTSSLGGGYLSTHFLSELSYATGSRLPFDIGHFNHCRNIQGSRFMLVTLLTDQRGMAERIIEVGMCVPSSCIPSDVKAIITMPSFEERSDDDNAKKLLKYEDIEKMANPEHVGDLSILRTKGTMNAIAAALSAEKKGAQSDVAADDVRVEVTSSDTDLAKSDVASVLLQLSYAIFALGLFAATWLDLSPQPAKVTTETRGIEAPESTQLTSANTSKRPSKLHLLFQCFSLPLNYAKLRKVPEKTETDCLNGMRVLTMFWIIAGHTMLMPAAIAGYDNEGDLIASWGYRGTYVLQAILGAEVGVDTFFFLSGYLATRLTPHIAAIHDNFAKGKSGKIARAFPLTVTTCLAVAKRYLRLTPSLLFVMFIYYKILPFYGAGPFVVRFQKSVFKRCDPYWWTQLFYLQNFIPFDSDKVCIGWSWYLGNDMCFFLITPLILLGYKRKKSWGWAMIGIFFAATIGITGGLVEYFKLGLYIYDKHFQDYAYYAYSKPYTRIGAYLVGIAAALFYSENTEYLKRVHRYYYRAMTTLAIITMNVIVFAVAFNFAIPNSWGRGVTLAYLSLARAVWALCCGVITISCATGSMPTLNKFLSMDVWVPFARLCYAAYLVHPVVIKFIAANVTNYYHFSPADVLYRSIVNSIASFGAATIVYLAFERPIMSVESVFSKRSSAPATRADDGNAKKRS